MYLRLPGSGRQIWYEPQIVISGLIIAGRQN